MKGFFNWLRRVFMRQGKPYSDTRKNLGIDSRQCINAHISSELKTEEQPVTDLHVFDNSFISRHQKSQQYESAAGQFKPALEAGTVSLGIEQMTVNEYSSSDDPQKCDELKHQRAQQDDSFQYCYLEDITEDDSDDYTENNSNDFADSCFEEYPIDYANNNEDYLDDCTEQLLEVFWEDDCYPFPDSCQTPQQPKKKRSIVYSILTQETSPERTCSLTNWENLEVFLIEQFSRQPLLGGIELFDDEFKMLMQDFPKRFRAFIKSDEPGNYFDPILCIEIVQIAIRDSTSGSLWPQIAQRLGESKPTYSIMRMGRMFVDTMKQYQKAAFDSGENVSTILMHCFACNDCIPRLFDFLYAYYSLDLEHDMRLADVIGLRDIMTSGGYFSRKQYVLQQTIDALRYLPDLSIRRIEAYLDWIDQAYYSQEYHPQCKNRFVCVFERWRDSHPDFNGESTNTRGRYRAGKRLFTSPYLYLDMRTDMFYIVMPKQRLPFDCGSSVYWTVTTNEPKSIPCQLIEAVTCCQTEEIRLPFPGAWLLEHSSMELYAGDTLVRSFVINKDCYRAFDESGLCIMGRHLTEGKVYCYTKPGETLTTDAECDSEYTCEWVVKCYNFRNGMTVSFPDGTVTIIGYEQNEGLCASQAVEGASICDGDCEAFPLYAQMPKLFIKTLPERFINGRLSLGGSFYRISDLKYQRFELQNRTEEYGFIVQLPINRNGYPCYELSVDIPTERDIRVYRFAYLPGFKYRFESSEESLPYMFAPRGSVTISCRFQLIGRDMEKDPTKNEFGFVISPMLKTLSFELPQEKLTLLLDVPIVRYRFGEGAWTVSRPGSIWHSELQKCLEFDVTETEITLSLNGDAPKAGYTATYTRNQQDGIITCDLTPLRACLTRDTTNYSLYITIGESKRLFATVHTKCFVVSARLEGDYYSDTICGHFEIEGNNRCVASLQYYGELIAERVPIENGIMTVHTALKTGEYRCVVYEVEENEFGFEDQLYPIYDIASHLIDPANIEGHRFYLQSLASLELVKCELPIKHKRYWIDVEARSPSDTRRYIGTMRIQGGLHIYEPMRVTIEVPDRSFIDRCRILFFEGDEEMSFIYDYSTKEIVRHEAGGLHYMERYRRYTTLDKEDVFAVIYLNKEA